MQAFSIDQSIATQTAATEAAREHMRRMERLTGNQFADVLEASVIDNTMDAGFAIVHNIRLHHGQGQRAIAISTCHDDEGDCYVLTGL
ncbi:hypothetical protein LMG31506_02290 [Cupriavidus yeoncheonensis]|uniref:Uncharacterized protein n=1 Tax=Cupriavidus yeoncheonensis TaxID=1462994 RepID=A0A916IT73_9BURK|nr:hypothetical protein [Cupriavidus yeoncheonensis]CAG2140313.1 hypothetical protein LMG31506_02290 [Cupriavidus yeoncheonensis]